MSNETVASGLAVASVQALAIAAEAVTVDLVDIGNPGNAGVWCGQGHAGYGPARICGSVDYHYQMGMYEVTAGQYTEFLNSKAPVADPYGLYNVDMSGNYYGACGIQRAGNGTTADPYVYSVGTDYANRPVNCVSFWDAARFANWLNNGQGDGNTETGAYSLDGYNGTDGRTIARNAGATWVLPSEDEWFKAAYHKNDGLTGNYWYYPTGTDSEPGRDTSESSNPGNNVNRFGVPSPIDPPYYTTTVGEFELSDSPYGTFDQGGNVWEWNETVVEAWYTGATRELRGGCWNDGSAELFPFGRAGRFPTHEIVYVGFRVARVPEPGSTLLLIAGSIGLLAYGRQWRR